MSQHSDTNPSTTTSDTAKARSVRRKRVPRWLMLLIAGIGVVAGLAGVVAGYAIGQRRGTSAAAPTSKEPEVKWWTCSMHPTVKLPEFGLCPICAMDLIPLDEHPSGPRELKMSKEAVALANIQVQPVERKHVTKTLRMVGKIAHDETRMADITAWVAGRLDRLFVNYTGVTVRPGDHLVEMYSPDLIVAQRELLQAVAAHNRPGNLDRQLTAKTLKSVEEKLRLMGLLEGQIEEIKRRGTPSDRLTIYAPVGGIVTQRHANEGAYVNTGTKIYTIVDLSQVWVYLDAYESDIPWLRYGQEVEFTTESYPGETFTGTIVFIDPELNPKTRTSRVRVNVPNKDLRLKPGMFVRAMVHSKLAAGGRVMDASLAGKWVSPMHPEVVKDGPGKCDVCGMDLVPAETLGLVSSDQPTGVPLVIPASAPLVTGKRAVVYVQVPTSADLFKVITTAHRAATKLADTDEPSADDLLAVIETMWQDASRVKRRRDAVEIPPGEEESNFDAMFRAIETAYQQANDTAQGRTPTFEHLSSLLETAWTKATDLTDWEGPSFDGREVVLGYRAGDYYLVERGLEEGELVVTDGNFKIDSALQIQAKPSMMSAAGGAQLEVSDEFRGKLAAVYSPYLKLQEALADDRYQDALDAWHAMRASLAEVPSQTLNEEVSEAWQKTRASLEQTLTAEPAAGDIEDLRKRFEPLAMTMLRMVDIFGHVEAGPLYEAYCPMAFKNKGAPWLQAGQQIANPYFGHRMLRCGEIRGNWPSAAKTEAEGDQP